MSPFRIFPAPQTRYLWRQAWLVGVTKLFPVNESMVQWKCQPQNPSYAEKPGRYKMAIFVQLNRVETPLPHKRPLLIDNPWSPPATYWMGSFTILPRME